MTKSDPDQLSVEIARGQQIIEQITARVEAERRWLVKST